MKVKLPKEIVGVKFPKICTIEMNDFDIDLFLPSLFFTVLAQGRGKAKQTNDPKAIQQFIDALAHHEALQGFDDVEGRKVLERLVRTTLITTGGVGRSSIGEQITSIVPYSLLSYIPGFPTEGSRHRGADTFIYQALSERIKSDHLLRNFIKETFARSIDTENTSGTGETDDAIRAILKKAFGKGVNVGSILNFGGSYDGKSQLDILTRFSIAFLDGFTATKLGTKPKNNIPSLCPALAGELANDLFRYLLVYYNAMPAQVFAHQILILLNFELFNYTLKLVYAVNELVQNPAKLPSAMHTYAQISAPSIYLDFTNSPSGYSVEMARASVRCDIEAYQQFLSSNLLLRQLNVYAEKLRSNPRYKTDIEKVLNTELSGGQYLQGLLELRNNPLVGLGFDIAADFDEATIRKENTQTNEQDNPDELQWLDSLVNNTRGSVERVVSLLVEGQQAVTIRKYIQWYQGVGGLKKPHGVLRGNSNRKSWRYAPTNDLLAMFVQLAAARHMPIGTTGEEEVVPPIYLREFLQFLEERFGILVDRPPAQFEGAEYAAAARDNLRAMLRRLRQMGIFHDLSDDFTVQRLHPPYASKIAAKVEE